MKYIDSEKLIAEIERLKNQTERRLDNIVPIRKKDTMDEEQLAKIELRDKVDKAYLNGVLITLSDVLSCITSLQPEQPDTKEQSSHLEHWLAFFGCPEENIEKCATQISQGYGAIRYLEGVQRGAEAVNELAQQEQPEVDLEREIIKYKVPFSDDREYLNEQTIDAIARHFYELGLNARKEETK